MKKHYKIRIQGYVQGIGFRFAAVEKARELHVKGFVRNEDDGSVYIEAEGEERLVNQFIKWCEKGPRFARVDKILVAASEVKDFSNFVIL